MSVKITYFVHGTTQDNIDGLASGQNDIGLSEKGVEESKKLGETRRDDFEAVFISDLKRAVDSAELAWGNMHNVIVDSRLRECDYGDFTQKKKTWKISDYIDKKYPNGESYKDVEKRIRSLLDFVKENFDGEHIAFLAHEAPQLALEVIIDSKTWKQAIKENWRNTKSWQPGWDYVLD